MSEKSVVRCLRFIFNALLGLCGIASLASAHAAAPSLPQGQAACDALKGLHLSDATLVGTQYVSGTFTPASKNADTLRGANANSLVGLPDFCRVLIRVKPSIDIEVWLPERWNQRFQAVGGGGYAGFIAYDAMALAIKQGYATASTDTGHVGTPLEGKFVLNADRTLNRGLIDDFARRAVHEMTVQAKATIAHYYQQPARYSYWNGCSTGGRQGLMEAQQYPADYNGIYVGAPAIHWDRFIVAELWPKLVMRLELGRDIDPTRLEAVNNAIVAAYDTQDGVRDGVIAEPDKINVSDGVLQGAGLSAQEIRVLRLIWAGPRSQQGKSLWYGLEPGAPFALANNAFPIATDYLGVWLQRDARWQWKTLTYAHYERLMQQSQRQFGPILATDNPDLGAFRKAGAR